MGFLANIKRYKYLYMMMIPGLLFYILFMYFPMYGIIVAFQRYQPLKGFFGSEWVGFMHFRNLFDSALFFSILRNTLLLSIYKLVWGFPVPIILALALNEVRNATYKKIVQSISYLPYFLSWVVLSGVIYVIFNEQYGVLATLFRSKGLDYLNLSRDPEYFRSFLVLSSIWKTAGWSSILYLAALTNIDPQLYEAADMDGANKWHKMTAITIPSIAPIMAVVLILSVGTILQQDFEQVFILSAEIPSLIDVSDTFESYVFRNGIRKNEFSFPAAVGLFQSFFGMWLVLGVNKLSKRLGYNSIW